MKPNEHSSGSSIRAQRTPSGGDARRTADWTDWDDRRGGNQNAEETVHDTIGIALTRDRKFVGAAMALGVLDLPFVDSGTNVLTIEKKRTENALFVRITRSGAP